MKYYIIAGEASGDLHAANLMKAIQQKDERAQFRVWGGNRMKAAGGELVKHYRDLAFMGFAEVIKNLPAIINNLTFCKKDIAAYKPDVLILVDYPGFNLRIAEFAKKSGLKVVYYISPQIWAWKQSRVKKIKKYVDKMIVILPFEQEFYHRKGLEVDFVGHPQLDALAEENTTPKKEFFEKNLLEDRPIIALLPGSRKQEVAKTLSIMLEVMPYFDEYQFVVAGVNTITSKFYRGIIGERPAHVLIGKTHDLLHYTEAALVTSGTATLETALIGVPEVVCYKGSKLSFMIARRVVKVKYASLVNLILNREVVKELIQHDLTKENLVKGLNNILRNTSDRKRLKTDYAELRKKLGEEGASERAANLIVDFLVPPHPPRIKGE